MTRHDILAQLAAGILDADTADRLLSELEVKKIGQLFCKISQRGALSVYGLQRMPVTLYADQWQKLLAFAPTIQEFIATNRGQLRWRAKEKKETEIPWAPAQVIPVPHVNRVLS